VGRKRARRKTEEGKERGERYIIRGNRDKTGVQVEASH